MRLALLAIVLIVLVLGIALFWLPGRESVASSPPGVGPMGAAPSGVAPDHTERASRPERAEPVTLDVPVPSPAAEATTPVVATAPSAEPAASPESLPGLEIRVQAPGAPKIDPSTSNADLRALAMNLALLAEERIRAAQALRYRKEEDGTDARTPELVRSLIELAAAVTDGEQRGDIWKALDECRDPQLVDPLLESLRYDGEVVVREEAAESLGTFVSDPRVREALVLAAETDPSPKVQKEAKGSLDG